ncbi:MAG: hypothetical protein QM775_08970 [Pirellulales bacterium]
MSQPLSPTDEAKAEGLRRRVMSLQLPQGAKTRPAVPWLRFGVAGVVIVMLLGVAYQAAAPWLAALKKAPTGNRSHRPAEPPPSHRRRTPRP